VVSAGNEIPNIACSRRFESEDRAVYTLREGSAKSCFPQRGCAESQVFKRLY